MILQELLNAYIELNRLHAAPGEKCHMIASSIAFIQKKISEEINRQKDSPASFIYTTSTEEIK